MDQSLESRVKSLEATLSTMQKDFEASVGSLKKELAEKEREIQDLQDIEAIKRLQCAYGYYLEHWMSEEIIALFADHPDVSGNFSDGIYLGLEGIRRYFGKMKIAPPTFLHMVMQVSPVITLNGDGKTAKGRWYGYGTVCATPVNDEIDPTYMSVIYEMDYIKQDGIWKILKLAFQRHFAYKPSKKDGNAGAPPDVKFTPDIRREVDYQYPSGHIYPFHYTHPVTGRETSEKAYNATLTLKPNTYGN